MKTKKNDKTEKPQELSLEQLEAVTGGGWSSHRGPRHKYGNRPR